MGPLSRPAALISRTLINVPLKIADLSHWHQRRGMQKHKEFSAGRLWTGGISRQ
jgi:hypothetical protein